MTEVRSMFLRGSAFVWFLVSWAALAGAEPCPRCGWDPPRTAATVIANSMNDLRRAVNRARPGSTILLGDGTYQLDGVTLDIPVRGLVLRGRKGRQSRVLIRGHGMGERMVAISVSAPGVTLADLTISQVGFHGIQVRGESRRPRRGDPPRPHPGHGTTTDQGERPPRVVTPAAKGWWPARRSNTRNPPRAITRTASTSSTANAGWSATTSCGGSGALRPGLSRRAVYPVLGRLARHGRRAQPADRLLPRDRPGVGAGEG